MTTCPVAKSVPTIPCSVRHTAALGDLSAGQLALVEEALTMPLGYVQNDRFAQASAERELFDEGMAIAPASTSWYHPMLAEELFGQATPRASLLSGPQETHLFLRYNYARWRAVAAVQKFRTRPSSAGARDLALWHGRVKETRDLITRANLALVLAMAKRTSISEVDRGDLISEGNMALLRAIDAFDVGRGFKFSTYACRAILKAFSRIAQRAFRYRATFPAEFDPQMERSDYQDTRHATLEQEAAAELQRIIRDNRAQLSEVEKTVICARFALGGVADAPSMTLAEVGQVVGVTKERVRQIQNKALAKLRAALDSEVLGR